ncbi:hypothetical protein JW835_04225 [bacterium]|nr:hypothetical protein [bacterium]RQV97485.1 MAG: hypothetical protein EH221_03645 [bacterium]
MNLKNQIKTLILLFAGFFLLIGSRENLSAQEWKWLRIGEIQCYFSNRGTEVEGEGYGNNTNFLSWPSQYGTVEQTTMRQTCMWIGCRNFYDTRLGREMSVKVVGVGPRDAEERKNMIFENEMKLIGKYSAPVVEVDGELASDLSLYDEVDEYDPDLPCDRMIVIKINTSIGISVTKKIMAFSQSDHNNYFIYDYTFKNTGIINRDGDRHEQSLDGVYFYFAYRYAFSGESLTGYSEGWGSNTSSWGANTLNHAFGSNPLAARFNDPDSPYYQMRAFYAYYSPDDERPVAYEGDWGCPNQDEDGVMSGAKFAGNVTLHADTDVDNQGDDIYQPITTWYVSSDESVWSSDVSQIDEIYMQQRYEFMSEGHPEKSHAEMIAENYLYTQEYEEVDSKRNVGGGTSQGQGYGPYDLAPGDSVRIVFAQGISGLCREKNREVGWNWVQHYNAKGNPELMMPDKSITSDHNEYKKAWVFTGIDSVIKTYRNAMNNYQSGYSLPEAPPPPDRFTVTSGGDRIRLSWADNAISTAGFDGYVVYRTEGNVLDPDAVYKKVFECNASNAVHTWDDTSAARGFHYFYYIQSKNDGSNNGGTPLYSGLFWTVTNKSANLRRRAESFLSEVRVVPNPYDIRSRMFQFGENSYYDQIVFYGLPPQCKLKVYTERGDLIWEREHTDGSGDEIWNSLTSSRQIIVSGIYLLYVEVTENIYAESDTYAWHKMYDKNRKLIYDKGDLLYKDGEQIYKAGEQVIRKFVVIR